MIENTIKSFEIYKINSEKYKIKNIKNIFTSFLLFLDEYFNNPK